MIKVIKFNDPSQKKFFTSDLHLYHDQEFIWKEEKYQSALDRVNKIRVKINEIVGHKDILFITGDSFLNTTEELVVNFFRSIVCQNIYYVFGNHESSINRLYKKSVQEKYPELPPNTQITPWISPQIPNVTFLGDYAEVIVEGQKIALSTILLPSIIKNIEAHGIFADILTILSHRRAQMVIH